jgi:hypothetical protein
MSEIKIGTPDKLNNRILDDVFFDISYYKDENDRDGVTCYLLWYLK